MGLGVRDPSCSRGAGSVSTLLPERPAHDWASDHRLLGNSRFSHIPRKHRPDTTLPPMRLGARTLSEGVLLPPAGRAGMLLSSSSRGMLASGGAIRRAKCLGDFCGERATYPSSLLDLESSLDPWMVQARELCARVHPKGAKAGAGGSASSASLLSPEEMAACLPPTASPTHGARLSCTKQSPVPALPGGTVLASWLVEARARPQLCAWLASSECGWMLDVKDPEKVTEVARLVRADDETLRDKPPAVPIGRCQPGLRYRVQEVPVCAACLQAYSVVHGALELVRTKRDRGARKEIRRRREREITERRDNLESWTQLEKRGDITGGFEARSRQPRAHESFVTLDDDAPDASRHFNVGRTEVTVPTGSPAGSASSGARVSFELPASQCVAV